GSRSKGQDSRALSFGAGRESRQHSGRNVYFGSPKGVRRARYRWSGSAAHPTGLERMAMEINTKTLGQWALFGSFGIILYYCFRIMEPFLMPIFLALILSTLLAPFYNSINKRLNSRPGLSALLVCLGLTLAIV